MKTALKLDTCYRVKHFRKGEFTLMVKHVAYGGEWVTGIVVEGKVKSLLACNQRRPGEELTVRTSFCSFVELGA